MKSKTKAFLIPLLCVLFLSCSNFLKSHSGQGRVSIVLPYGDSALSRKALTVDKDNLDYILTISNNTDFSMTKTAKSGEKINILLDEGNYRIDALAYDSSDSTRKFPLYRGSTETNVVSDRTTNVELGLWRISAANFFRNEWGDVQAGQYEYNWGADVKDLYPDFDKLLKKGDCATVTLKGVANTSFKGTIYARFAQGYHKNTWSQIGRSSRNFNFDAGEEVTLTFDLIAEEDALEIADTQFNLYYKPDSYDDELTINDFSIEFNFEPSFTAIEHSIHVGTNVYTVYSKKGADFLLPDYDYINERANYSIWAFSLDGWYKDKDFTDNAVTKIPASQNTETMDFYAKLSLNLAKNVFGDPSSGGRYYNYCGSFVIEKIVEGFDTLPARGETVNLMLEGSFSDDFDGNLGVELADNTEDWDIIRQKRMYVNAKKGEKFNLYYNITLPEDKSLVDLEHTLFNFYYDYETRDKPVTINDFKVTLYGEKYGRIYNPKSNSTKNLTLETHSDGILVTANLIVDGTRVSGLQIEDVDSKAQFRVNDDVIKNTNESLYSFVWPLCTKDKLYNLELKYHNNKDDTDYYEATHCIAGGGLTEVDYSNYDNMSLSFESAEEERNVVIKDFDIDNYDILDLSDELLDKVHNQGFEVTLVSGVKDWSNTSWVYVYNYNFEDEPEGTIYEDLLSKGKFNILTNYYNWKTPAQINKALSERSLFFIGMRSYFMLDGYDDGQFFSKELLSDEIQYTPYIFPDDPAKVSISITYPENYTPDFSVIYRSEILEDGLKLSYLYAQIGKLLDNINYYWYIDNKLVQSGSSNNLNINELLYSPKIYDAKCIATYEEAGEQKVLEADYYLRYVSNGVGPIIEINEEKSLACGSFKINKGEDDNGETIYETLERSDFINDVFTVRGTVIDDYNRVEETKWEFFQEGKVVDSGIIEGNNFKLELDTKKKVNNKSVYKDNAEGKLRIISTDSAGNESSITRTYYVYQETDYPLIEVRNPKELSLDITTMNDLITELDSGGARNTGIEGQQFGLRFTDDDGIKNINIVTKSATTGEDYGEPLDLNGNNSTEYIHMYGAPTAAGYYIVTITVTDINDVTNRPNKSDRFCILITDKKYKIDLSASPDWITTLTAEQDPHQKGDAKTSFTVYGKNSGDEKFINVAVTDDINDKGAHNIRLQPNTNGLEWTDKFTPDPYIFNEERLYQTIKTDEKEEIYEVSYIAAGYTTGQLTQPATFSYKIDNVKPVISISTMPDKDTSTLSSFKITGTSSDEGSGLSSIEVMAADNNGHETGWQQAALGGDGSWFFTLVYGDFPAVFGTNGIKTIKARAYDVVGNCSIYEERNFLYDTTDPVILD